MQSRLDYFPEKELIGRYRQVFSSNEGQEVLTHMLFDLGVFEDITADVEDIALRNYGTRLLKILAGGELSDDNIKNFVGRLIKQPLKTKEREE